MAEDFLGSSCSEAGDNDVSTGSVRACDGVGEELYLVFRILVQAVTIGGLHEDIIRFFDEGRIAKNGHVPAADISRKQHRPNQVPLPNRDPQHSRPQDVSGDVERGFHAFPLVVAGV